MRCGRLARAILGAAIAAATLAPVAAQVPEIRLARQYSMGYPQLNVMEHGRLIEKHAKALGLAEVSGSWQSPASTPCLIPMT